MNTTVVIAKKEFSENLRSTRFIILFGLFLFMLLLSAYSGTQNYADELESYNENMGTGNTDIPKPSILTAFQQLLGSRMVSSGITIIGAIIGIVIGFDAIVGERESGTLKFLLTQPIYRDTLINGKLLGFTILIFTVVAISSVMTIAVIGGITGVFPGGDELPRILVFNVMMFFYIMTFAVIGLFFSVFLKQSVDALLAAIAVFIIVTLLISPVATAVASFIAPMPSQSQVFVMRGGGGQTMDVVFAGGDRTASNRTGTASNRTGVSRGWQGMGEEMRAAMTKNRNVMQTIMYLSPSENFEHVNEVILDPYSEEMGGGREFGFGSQIHRSLPEGLGMVWGNIIALLVWLIVFFLASYVMFLRQDVGR